MLPINVDFFGNIIFLVICPWCTETSTGISEEGWTISPPHISWFAYLKDSFGEHIFPKSFTGGMKADNNPKINY